MLARSRLTGAASITVTLTGPKLTSDTLTDAALTKAKNSFYSCVTRAGLQATLTKEEIACSIQTGTIQAGTVQTGPTETRVKLAGAMLAGAAQGAVSQTGATLTAAAVARPTPTEATLTGAA